MNTFEDHSIGGGVVEQKKTGTKMFTSHTYIVSLPHTHTLTQWYSKVLSMTAGPNERAGLMPQPV